MLLNLNCEKSGRSGSPVDKFNILVDETKVFIIRGGRGTSGGDATKCYPGCQ